jgi:hypothetical protein
VGADDPVILGDGEQDTRDPVPHRAFIDIPDIDDNQEDPHDGKDKNIVPAVLSLETIFQRLSYKMHQVLDDHCTQAHTEAYEDGQEVEKPVTG